MEKNEKDGHACTKIQSCQDISWNTKNVNVLLETLKLRGSPKAPGFISWVPLTAVGRFMAIYPLDVERFHPGRSDGPIDQYWHHEIHAFD